MFLYLAFDRYQPQGTTFLAFNLNQNDLLWQPNGGRAHVPCRRNGDLSIGYATSGGNFESISVQEWETDSAEPPPPLGNGCARTGSLVAAHLIQGVDWQAAVNATEIPANQNFLPGHYASRPIPMHRFGEAAIDLTKVEEVLHPEGDHCREFLSIWMFSRSGGAGSALNDYVAPHRVPIAVCPREPGLKTRTQRHVVVGQPIHDTARLSGGLDPTGTLTFHLYGPGQRFCRGTPVFTWTAAVDGNGFYRTSDALPDEFFTATGAGTYRWVVSYSGDVNNHPAATDCGDPAETVRVSRASPSLSTTASAAHVHLPQAILRIYDVAHLRAGFNPRGVITFRLYGPTQARCSGRPVFISRVIVNGNDDNYRSAEFTPTRAGTFRWVITYSGDHNNRRAGPTACGDPDETTVIHRAQPTIVTDDSGNVEMEEPISDTAFLDGGANPTGTITFHLYGPGDPDCIGPPARTVEVPVLPGIGTYHSGDVSPPANGTYVWVAHYSGDHNNKPASSRCGDPFEHVLVSGVPLARPMLTTTASAGVPAGSPIYDTAHLTGGRNPTGGITFRLYGPDDYNCLRSPTIVDAYPTGEGDWVSPKVSPAEAGTYRWVVLYHGDHDNSHAGPTHCHDPDEKVVVSRAQPALRTAASPSASVGLPVRDTAFLSGGSNPTGMITFELFGPNNPTCSPPAVFSESVDIAGNGRYPSPTFVPRQAGTYRWKVTYSGDRNNHTAVAGCGGSGETVVVPRRLPLLTTQASTPRPPLSGGGFEIHDTATLRLGFRPTGEIVFALFGPDNPTCNGTPIFTSATAVNGNGVYNSDGFPLAALGVYDWVAFYSGDRNNFPIRTACGASTERLNVLFGPFRGGLATVASPAVDLGGAIHDTALLTARSPTGTITFRLYGSSDTTCTGPPIFTSTVNVAGGAAFVSGSYVPSGPGVFRWVAEYSGDIANARESTPCDDPLELGIVRPPGITPVVPTFSTTASQYPAGGQTLYDTAHLAGGTDPGGAITFTLYGPDDQTCTGPPAFTSVVTADGNGNYRSATFSVIHPGTYRWVATYSGDAMNTSAGPTHCGEATETTSVSATPTPTPDPGPNVAAPPKPHPKPPSKPHPKPPPPPPFTG